MLEAGLRRVDWQLPESVHAYVTTRRDGVSKGPYASFNLGSHVHDDAEAVATNRRLLREALADASGLQGVELQWARQVHGTQVRRIDHVLAPPEADALYTRRAGIACGVLTADCLPLLLCAARGGEVAVAHAGWRGLAAGVLENTLACFDSAPEEIRAWLGPAIGPCHFEVGPEVREAFLARAGGRAGQETEAAFRVSDQPGKYMADLYRLASIRLRQAGVVEIAGKVQCTVCDDQRWYSYRRDGITGRNATLILRSE